MQFAPCGESASTFVGESKEALKKLMQQFSLLLLSDRPAVQQEAAEVSSAWGLSALGILCPLDHSALKRLLRKILVSCLLHFCVQRH